MLRKSDDSTSVGESSRYASVTAQTGQMDFGGVTNVSDGAVNIPIVPTSAMSAPTQPNPASAGVPTPQTTVSARSHIRGSSVVSLTDETLASKPLQAPRKPTSVADSGVQANSISRDMLRGGRDAVPLGELEDNRPIEMLDGIPYDGGFQYQAPGGPQIVTTEQGVLNVPPLGKKQKPTKPAKKEKPVKPPKPPKPGKGTKNTKGKENKNFTPQEKSAVLQGQPEQAATASIKYAQLNVFLPCMILVILLIIAMLTLLITRTAKDSGGSDKIPQLMAQIGSQQQRISELEEQLGVAGATGDTTTGDGTDTGTVDWASRMEGTVTATPEYAESLQPIRWHGLELYTPRDTTMISMDIQNDQILLKGDGLQMEFRMHLQEADMQNDLNTHINKFMADNVITDFVITNSKSEARREFIQGTYTRDGTGYEQYFAILHIKNDVHMFVNYEYATGADTVSQKTLESAIIANVIPRFN